MASNKKKQDEKHLKMLREMVALPSNKTCFDCHQRGPTYVNMTIGSFVCTSCSGILRGLNPPHRVKSISMASFTPDEMDFLKSHGNELNRKVYLGLYDNRTWPEPDSRDEQRVRDFMVQKYENKRFYVAPTEAMREEARRMNDAALSKQPQTKPLRALLGENATRLVVGNSQTSTASQNSTQSSAAPGSMSTPAKSSALPPAVTAHPPQQPPAKPAGGGGFDLLGELGSDPFASSAPSAATASTGGFADFSNFGSSPVTAPALPAPQSSAPSAFPPMSGAPLQPFGGSSSGGGGGGLQPQPLSATPAGPGTAPPSSTPTQPPSQTSFSAISDKYAALADLDSTFNTAPTNAPTPTVNWGGSDISSAGSSVNWGGSDSGGGSSISWGGLGSTGSGSGDGGSMGWGAPAGTGGGGGLNWNSSGTTTAATGGVFGGGATSTDPWQTGRALGTPGNPFRVHSPASNPFGGSSTVGMPAGGAMPGQANPFGTAPQPAGFGAPATATPGFSQPPASSTGGFGFQQFPVQNGGFGMATTAGGFAPFGGPPPCTAPPSYGMAQQQGFQAQPGGVPGFPPQPGMGGGWGQMGGVAPPPSSANPFMSAASQQQMAPRGKSTNPFL
ncbi:uncharacterized protein LOC143289142 isoform X1 [Babylonia areolata]|uniref:uncharacterized protein LOC143289142 isoform X1 n=1 Tax=Babylonia areolata TaxID=304850 RepID=UPI003FCFE021